jgi:hypothetical protein
VSELRFAGSTWDEGSGNATTIAVFETAPGSPPLAAAWVQEFYETGARNSSKTDNITTSKPAIDGVGEAWRLDVLNDLSYQSIVVWSVGSVVHVVLVATQVRPDASMDTHNARVAAALAAGVAGPGASLGAAQSQ